MPGFLLLSAAAFIFSDPAGDAHGDGHYVLPTQPAITPDALDLREFRAESQNGHLRLSVGFGALANPWKLPSGFSAGVTDIFVKSGLGGVQALDDLRLQAVSGGWQYHVRVSGAGSRLEQRTDGRAATDTLAAPTVQVQGTTLVIDTAIPAGEYGYWVTNSVYSPLTPDGLLRPTTQAGASGLQAPRADAPVPVDVLARPGDTSAYQNGMLAAVGQDRDPRPWWLAGLGLLGLMLTVLTTMHLWRLGR